ncbi:hypothetical protein CASFOL_036927 [Castilleja foliolosa]|uniref:KIB1-4 beta-propeller domain-containing protein n=1 Tax=Castilleja foliolosa TaxID=1961234 RepID=A0ABD3BQ07_9LAMI
MAPSILKITTAISLRCIFRSCRGVRMFSTVNKSDESRTSSVESRISFFSSSYPWLMLSPRSCNNSYEFYSFAEKRVLSIPKSDHKYEVESGFHDATRILGSSHGWLACYNHLRAGELFLYNPLSGRRINLPPVHKLSNPESNLVRKYGCKRIIMTCSDPESEECRVVMIFGERKRLALCCPGRSSSSTEWTVFESEQARSCADFVYCGKHQLFFSLKYEGQLAAWDLQNPLSPRLVWSMGPPRNLYFGPSIFEMQEYSDAQGYLVVSQQQQGKLFLVLRYLNRFMMPNGRCAPLDSYVNCKPSGIMYPPKTVGFDVFKIVRVQDGWKLVEMDDHLDDLVMFLGDPSDGIAMPAANANGFQPNSICFTNDCFSSDSDGIISLLNGTDNGIFDFEKKTMSPCYYPFDYKSLKNKILPPPLWFTPNIPIIKNK